MYESKTEFFHWFLFENFNDETVCAKSKENGQNQQERVSQFYKLQSCKHQAYTTLPLNVEQRYATSCFSLVLSSYWCNLQLHSTA